MLLNGSLMKFAVDSLGGVFVKRGFTGELFIKE
jgi:hypothetical protein